MSLTKKHGSKLIVENKEFYRKLKSLVFPAAFQQFMVATVSASDAIMLGMINQNSLSAASIAGQIQFVLSLFIAAITIGESIFVAQYWGKGDKIQVEKIFAFSFKLSVFVSFVFFIFAFFMPENLLRIFTNESELIKIGAQYLKVVSPSYLLCGASQIYLCIMKNSEQAAKSSIISSVAVVLNIFLNAVLIFGLFGFRALGITGAAVATVLSRFVELAWTVINSLRKNHVKLRLRFLFTIEKTLKVSFWKYTLPVLGNEIVWGCGFAMFTVILGHLGTDAVAASSIANIVKNLAACFCLGIGIGGGIMVGNELGSGNLEKAKLYGKKLCHISIISGAISGILLLAFIPFVLNLSTLSKTANYYLKWMLVMCSYYLIGKAINGTTIAGIFCAGGDSKFGFICDAITLWLVIIPLGFIAAFVLKLPIIVVYFILNLDEIIKLPAVFIHYKKYIWVKDLTAA